MNASQSPRGHNSAEHPFHGAQIDFDREITSRATCPMTEYPGYTNQGFKVAQHSQTPACTTVSASPTASRVDVRLFREDNSCTPAMNHIKLHSFFLWQLDDAYACQLPRLFLQDSSSAIIQMPGEEDDSFEDVT